MIHRVYSVFDAKTEAYLPPFYVPNKGHALRSFAQACNDPLHDFSRYAEDFTLFEIGEFDDATGRFEQHKSFLSLGLALEHKKIAEGKSLATN